MFKEERDELKFDWSMIGDIGEGRPNLGNTMDVSVYRLMQFTLRDVLIKHFDAQTADRIFYEAGEHAGKEFYKELITQKDDFNEFVYIAYRLFDFIIRIIFGQLNRSRLFTLKNQIKCFSYLVYFCFFYIKHSVIP